MLRTKQEEHEEPRRTVPPVRPLANSQPSGTALSEEDEAFLSRLQRGEELRGTHRTLPSLTTPPQAVMAPPSSLSLAEWWDHLVTNNPVFHKEILAQKRLSEKKLTSTRLTEKVMGFVGVMGLYGGLFYLMSLAYGTNDPKPAFWFMHGFLVLLQSLILMIALPLQGATAITSEREKMTWNALLLSRNSPLQILAGKAASVLRTIGLFYLAVLPALLLTAWGTGMSWTNFLASQVLMIVTALMNASIALFCSLNGKKSQQASANAGGWAIIPILGLPGLTAIIYAVPSLIANMMQTTFTPPAFFNWLAWLPNLFNPAGAILASLTNPQLFGPNSGIPAWLWFFVPTFYLAAASLTIRGLWKRMLTQFWSAPKDLSG